MLAIVVQIVNDAVRVFVFGSFLLADSSGNEIRVGAVRAFAIGIVQAIWIASQASSLPVVNVLRQTAAAVTTRIC